MVYQENRKKILSQDSWEQLQRGKNAPSTTWVLQILATNEKLSWLDEVLIEEKRCNLKKWYFQKKEPKVKKRVSRKLFDYFRKTVTFHDSLPQFYS